MSSNTQMHNLLLGTGKVVDSAHYRAVQYALAEPLVVGRTYTLTAYVEELSRTPLPSGVDQPLLVCYDGAGWWCGGSLSGDVPGVNAVTFTYKQPMQDHKDPTHLQLYNTPPVGGSDITRRARFRDVMLVEGTTPAAWAPAEGESLPWGGALMSANLLEGATVTRGTRDDDGYWVLSQNDGSDKKDSPMWSIDGQSTLAEDQTMHLACSAMPDADWPAGSCMMSVQYTDAAGSTNWAAAYFGAAKAGPWTRLEASVVVPAGMHVTMAVISNAYSNAAGARVTGVMVSYGDRGPILASDSHTPYATQEHIVELYATKASLEVTNNSIKSEVSERTTLANTVSSLSSSLNATDQNVSNLQSGLATTNSNLATTNSNLDTANTNISNLENSIANTNKKVQTNTSNISQLSSSIVSAVKGESTYTDPYGNTVTNTLASKIEQTSTNLTLKFNNYTTTSDMNDTIATAKSEATSAANSNTASKLVDYTKTNDLASTAAVKDAKKAGTDAATAASAAQSTASKAVTNAATAQSTANTAVSNAAAAQQSANNAQTTASDAQSKANNLMTMIRASEAGIEIGKSSDGTTFTTTRTKIDEDSFDILDKNGNVLNTFEKTGQTLYVEGVDNFSVRSDPNYQTYVYTDAHRFTINSKNRVITYGVYDVDLTLAENAILGMYVYTESGMDTEDLKSRITSTVKDTNLPSHTGKPGLTGTIITVSYDPSSSTDKITKYGMNRVALKINSNGKILAFNFGTSNSHVGYGSMTLGYGNLATGSYSTAFGVNTESHGDNSVSIGTGTYAMRSNSLAVGIYNDPRSNTLFSVGNGTDQDNRSNAFWVNDDGAAKAASFISSRGLGTSGTLDVQGHSTLNTLLVANNFSANSTANISGALTAGSIKTSGSLSSGPITSGAITSGDISSGALTIHGSRKIDGIWEGSKVLTSAGQSSAFMSASEFQTITGYSLSSAQVDWAFLASNGEWGSSVGRNFTLGWTSNYINVAVNPSTNSQIRVNYTFIKFV